MSVPRVHAIVPAAGAGRRLAPEAETPKQYRKLLGHPLLQWSVECISAHPAVCAVTVAVAPGDTDFMTLAFAGDTPVDWAVGGDSRAHSVRNAITHVMQTSAAEWVLVHDAARPCLDRVSLDRLLRIGLAHADGAILAHPVSDTLKRAATPAAGQDGGAAPESLEISGTVDREQLWAAQTPQLFPTARLAAALDARLAAGLPPTDEAGAMEAAGARPLLVRGAASNMKVTWPGDMAVAEAILRMAERHS